MKMIMESGEPTQDKDQDSKHKVELDQLNQIEVDEILTMVRKRSH